MLAFHAAGDEGHVLSAYRQVLRRRAAYFLLDFLSPQAVGKGRPVVQQQCLSRALPYALSAGDDDGAVCTAYDHSQIQSHAAVAKAAVRTGRAESLR